ncbi:hypothetical protein F5B20DRAFT_594412 [Whalleya microplaca]|nr:hypothetical protein F5B20DRAFT_594412 [Whalleya microplaca]
MADRSNGTPCSSVNATRSQEATSRLTFKDLTADDIVDQVLLRHDREDIYHKLFGQLYGSNISTMIKARVDSNKAYKDLFDSALAIIKRKNKRKSINRNGDTSGKNVLIEPSSSSRASGANNNASANFPNYSGLPTPALQSGTNEAPEKRIDNWFDPYTTHSMAFEPQLSDLGVWVPMFMSKEEFCNIGPRVNEMDTTRRIQNAAKCLFSFIKFLNPVYLCFRAECIFALAEHKNIMLPKMYTMDDTVKCWSSADSLDDEYIGNIFMAFAAVRCFNQCEKYMEKYTQDNRSFMFTEELDEDVELGICAQFARKEKGISSVLKREKDKWRNIMKYGEQLSLLQEDVGEQSFLLLFPLHELSDRIQEDLVNVRSIDYIWEVLKNVLQKTVLGEVFRSLSNTIGSALLSKFHGEEVSQSDFAERIDPILKRYSVHNVTRFSLRLNLLRILDTPEWAPFAFCGDATALRRLNAYSSFSPKSLLEFVKGGSKDDIIYHLIRQRLPEDWTILDRCSISQVATENTLLHDFKGIVIPLSIDGAWCLICYVNPTRSKTLNPITFLDPTKNESRHRVALTLLSDWIPKHGERIPQTISPKEVKVVDCQHASVQDSAIHVILNAAAMIKTGEPEARPLNAEVCKALRVKYFVTVLNDLHQASAKAALKRSPGNSQVTS